MQQESTGTIIPEINPGELESVRKTILSFISLSKVYSLYPADHAITRNNFAKFNDELENFFSINEILRLETRENSLYYEDELIFAGNAEENNPAYLLGRDGIEFIELVRGVTPAEIADFISIMNRFRNPPENSEGDIVTALWQRNFPHISYQEVDIFTLESFEFDLSCFQVTPKASLSSPALPEDKIREAADEKPVGRMESSFFADAVAQKNARHEQDGHSRSRDLELTAKTEQNRFLSQQDKNLLKLSAAEKEILKKYIQDQEQNNLSSDVIEVLLIILVTQHNREHFANVLEFFEYEFWQTMERGEFNLTYKLLNNLQIIREQFKDKRTWSVPLIDNFFNAVTDEDQFKQLHWIRTNDASWLDSPFLPHLWRVLRMLAPQIIFQLGSMLVRLPKDKARIRNEILKIIDEKTKEDPEKFRILMRKSGQRLILLLTPLLQGLPKQDAAEIYLQMTHHSAASVRRTGLDGYIASENNPDFEKLFHLLGDTDSSVRIGFINYLKNKKETIAATLLIRFLSEAQSTDHHEQKIIYRNYRALASCRSFNSLPFLEKNLLNGKLGTMFANDNVIHKRGAAHALKLIGTAEALSILEKGTKSLRPDIRYASRSALQD